MPPVTLTGGWGLPGLFCVYGAYTLVMRHLVCPACFEDMEVGEVNSERKRQAAINQLAEHSMRMHVLPAFENMLGYTAMVSESSGVEQLYQATQPLCAGCQTPVTEDTGIYYQQAGRTQHCHSKECYARAKAG